MIKQKSSLKLISRNIDIFKYSDSSKAKEERARAKKQEEDDRRRQQWILAKEKARQRKLKEKELQNERVAKRLNKQMKSELVGSFFDLNEHIHAAQCIQAEVDEVERQKRSE